MSELIQRNHIEHEAEQAFEAGKQITDNPYGAGQDAHFAWEQAYLRASIDQQIAA